MDTLSEVKIKFLSICDLNTNGMSVTSSFLQHIVSLTSQKLTRLSLRNLIQMSVLIYGERTRF